MIKTVLKFMLLAIVVSAGSGDGKKSWGRQGMTTSSNSTSTAIASATGASGAALI